MQNSSRFVVPCFICALIVGVGYVVFFRRPVWFAPMPTILQQFDALKLPEGAISSGERKMIYKASLLGLAQTYRVQNRSAADVLGFYRGQFEILGWNFVGPWGGDKQSLLFCKDALVANVDVSQASPEYGWIRYDLEIVSGDAMVRECAATRGP